MSTNVVNGWSRNTDTFFLDALSGEGGFLDGRYLPKHPMETDEDYAARRAQSIYPNYVEMVVGVYSGYLWQRPPARESSDLYARFVADADGQGTGLDMLMEQYQQLAMVLGTVWIIVDKPAAPAANRAVEGLPYLAMRMPCEVVDEPKQDAQGRITEIAFNECCDGETLVRRFTLTGWRLESKGGVAIEEGVYGFGRVPVVAIHSKPPRLQRDLCARPWAYNLIQQNWRLYKLRSEMDWLFSQQAFAQPIFPESDPQQREKLRTEGLVMGANTAWIFDPANGGRPGFVAPPPDPINSYQKELESAVLGIYEAANLDFVSGAGIQQAASTVSFYFQKANSALVGIASLTEKAERQIAWLVHAWMGQQDVPSLISYPRDFNLLNLADELKSGMDALSLQISPTFDQQVRKNLAKSVLGHGVAQATIEQIDNEIEGGADPYGDRAAKEAGNLPPINNQPTSGAP